MKKNVIISIISLIVAVFFFAACGEKESNKRTYFPQEWGKLISSSPVLWGENISEESVTIRDSRGIKVLIDRELNISDSWR